MKEVVLKNNSQSSIEIPLYEQVPVVVTKACKTQTLNPGEEIVLGCDTPTDRLRYYKQFSAIDIDLESREMATDPECEEITGIRAVDKVEASFIRYSGRNYVTVKYKKASIKKATNPAGRTGYWIGIAVVAPEGAKTLIRAFESSQNALDNYRDPVPESQFDKKVLDGKNGWYFYTDAGVEVPSQWIRTKWLAADGSVIEETDYYLDFSEITLA